MANGNWEAQSRIVRRVTSGINKKGSIKHIVNIPSEAFDQICSGMGDTGNTLQIVLLRNTKTGGHMIALESFDGYETLMMNLNKEA